MVNSKINVVHVSQTLKSDGRPPLYWLYCNKIIIQIIIIQPMRKNHRNFNFKLTTINVNKIVKM